MNQYQPVSFDLAKKESYKSIIEPGVSPVNQGEAALLVRDLLATIGENPEREGLQRTPERVARMFTELLSGYRTDLHSLVNGALFDSDYHSLVVVKDIEFYSLCEHHLLPFYGKAHVAYIPDGKIIGLSKIPRLVEMFARRLQVQERLTEQITQAIDEIIHPKGVAVLVEGAHMCAMMRGVKKSQTRMVTSAFRGEFFENEARKNEFFLQLKQGDGDLIFEE